MLSVDIKPFSSSFALFLQFDIAPTVRNEVNVHMISRNYNGLHKAQKSLGLMDLRVAVWPKTHISLTVRMNS